MLEEHIRNLKTVMICRGAIAFEKIVTELS